jgi:hypothetical protein
MILLVSVLRESHFLGLVSACRCGHGLSLPALRTHDALIKLIVHADPLKSSTRPTPIICMCHLLMEVLNVPILVYSWILTLMHLYKRRLCMQAYIYIYTYQATACMRQLMCTAVSQLSSDQLVPLHHHAHCMYPACLFFLIYTYTHASIHQPPIYNPYRHTYD